MKFKRETTEYLKLGNRCIFWQAVKSKPYDSVHYSDFSMQWPCLLNAIRYKKWFPFIFEIRLIGPLLKMEISENSSKVTRLTAWIQESDQKPSSATPPDFLNYHNREPFKSQVGGLKPFNADAEHDHQESQYMGLNSVSDQQKNGFRSESWVVDPHWQIWTTPTACPIIVRKPRSTTKNPVFYKTATSPDCNTWLGQLQEYLSCVVMNMVCLTYFRIVLQPKTWAFNKRHFQSYQEYETHIVERRAYIMHTLY